MRLLKPRLKTGYIILPVAAKDRPDMKQAHTKLIETILRNFVGFTKYHANGYWQDDEGKLHKERVARYEIASESASFVDGFVFAEAHRLLDITQEQAIMIGYSDGTSEIIERN